MTNKEILKKMFASPSKYVDPIYYFVTVSNEIQRKVDYSTYIEKSIKIASKNNKSNLLKLLHQNSKVRSERAYDPHKYIMNHPSYKYAIDVVNGDAIAGEYVVKQCQQFLDDFNNPNSKYFIDVEEMIKITNLLKLINMATGLKAGTSAYDALAGFQWFFIINILCIKHKSDPSKRRYETATLLIGRKNGKTFLTALIFILLLLTEPEFSEFYSVSADRELSSIVKKELEQAIEKSPKLQKHFSVTRQEIRCLLTNSKFVPLATSNNRMDGRRCQVYLADEVGALKDRYPIESMQSSQMNMKNRLGIMISTAYENFYNPMIEEVSYAEKVLDGSIDNETYFSLLYRPNDTKDWMSDQSLLEANPLANDLQDNLDYLKKQRGGAIEMPSKKKNFMTKHMNIFVDGDDSEVFISTETLQECRINSYDWRGREVYIGVDLSQTTDNTAVSMSTYDIESEKIISKSWVFYPADNQEEKSRIERLDYRSMAQQGYAFPCGDKVIDYSFVEDFVLSLEEKYGVVIQGIAYDRYNAISSANKWSNAGYMTIEVQQHSSTLHPATKLLRERILSHDFLYETNPLFEINVANARLVYDTNLNSYVNKKRSNGKIDMLAATINSIALLRPIIELSDEQRNQSLVSVF